MLFFKNILIANLFKWLLHPLLKARPTHATSSGQLTNNSYTNIIVYSRPNPNQEGQVLRYGQPFMLSTLPGVGGEVGHFKCNVVCDDLNFG